MQSGSDFMPQRGRPPKSLQQKLASSPANNKVRVETPSKKERRLKREQELDASRQQQKVQESFVMKLFDRSLDLSKYADKSSLYPICRAWMNNQPRNSNSQVLNYKDRRCLSTEREDNGAEVLSKLQRKELREITEFPLPKRTDLPLIPKTSINEVNRSDILPTKDNNKIEDNEPAFCRKEELMRKHLYKWKRVKSNWVKHQKIYQQQRYKINYSIIQELFKP